jgi:hypothetical protein
MPSSPSSTTTTPTASSNAAAADSDGRRIQRIGLTLPIRVEYKISPTVSWTEVTRLRDISAFGAGFNLPRPVKRGRLILMTIPLPRQLRCYDFMEPQYRVYGLVRHCIPLRRGVASPESYAIGTAFVGKHPPVSYLEDPSRLYDIRQNREDGQLWQVTTAPEHPDESHLPKELRRHSRFQIPVSVMLEMLNEDGSVTAGEVTVTENISLGGASVFTSLPAEVGSFLRVTSDQYNVSIVSVVRGKRLGPDGIPRLHIEFIDHFFPLEGIE